MNQRETDAEVERYGCTLAALEHSQPSRISRLQYVWEVLDEAEGRLQSEADMPLARQLLNRAKHLLRLEERERGDRWKAPVTNLLSNRVG